MPIGQVVREHGGSVQCATFAVDRLSRPVIFAPDSVEHERKKYRKHHSDLQVNGIADFMKSSTDVNVQNLPNKAGRRRRNDRGK
jgi:hypothetical protein